MGIFNLCDYLGYSRQQISESKLLLSAKIRVSNHVPIINGDLSDLHQRLAGFWIGCRKFHRVSRGIKYRFLRNILRGAILGLLGSLRSCLPPLVWVTVHGDCRSILGIESVRRRKMLQLLLCCPRMNLLSFTLTTWQVERHSVLRTKAVNGYESANYDSRFSMISKW